MEFGVKNKTFRGDIEILFNALKNGEKFSFSKYADGEYEILINNLITNCDNWTFNPTKHKEIRDELLSSFHFNDEGYYVGISCPCCVGPHDTKWMRENVGVGGPNLTWANIFVNSNYKYFQQNFIPEFDNHDIILIANKNANIDKLPFGVEEHIGISGSAFIDNFDLVNSGAFTNYKNKVFLFCAGPLGNMLAAKLWSENKDNTYIDIGSTLNPFLLGQKNRGYLMGTESVKKVCTW